MPDRPTPRTLPRLRAPTKHAAILAVYLLLLLSGCGPSSASALDSLRPTAIVQLADAQVAQPQPSPATEVARIDLAERIVAATPTSLPLCNAGSLGDQESVTLAAILPLSQPAGLTSSLGTQTALTLAVEAINAQGGVGGRPLRLLLGDAGSTPEQIAAAAQEAIGEECAAALVSVASGEMGAALLEVARARNVPLFVVEGSDDALTASGARQLFRLVPAAGMISKAYVDWLEAVGDYNGDGHRSVALVVEETEAAIEHAERVGSQLGGRGIEFDIYPVMLPRSDFSSLIARLVVREVIPDAVFIRFNSESALALHQQLIENGIGPARKSLIVAMRGALDHALFWPALGDGGLHTVASRLGPWPGAVNERGQEFAAAYARYLNRWPDAPSFAAYDAPFLFADAAVRADSLDGTRLIDALEQSDLTLAAGRYRFPYGASSHPENHDQPAWAWHQWMDAPVLFLQYTAAGQPSSEMAVIWPPAHATIDGAVVRGEVAEE